MPRHRASQPEPAVQDCLIYVVVVAAPQARWRDHLLTVALGALGSLLASGIWAVAALLVG
jgi:4-amino-4-deoxy-L-arabinose transferase-like glycosyltransferase